MSGQAIERVDLHVAPTGVAPAELREVAAQALILALYDLGGQVGDSHAASSSGQAVNVDPVVPVNRTRRYVPIHSAGPSSSAILFVRVRACSSAPRLAGPSTSTSCVVPTSAMFLRLATRRTSSMSRPIRSVLISSGT